MIHRTVPDATTDRAGTLDRPARSRGRLPAPLRQVFSYTFYHGWTQAEIAELLGISDRQVRRLWVEACLRLKAAVGDLPEG